MLCQLTTFTSTNYPKRCDGDSCGNDTHVSISWCYQECYWMMHFFHQSSVLHSLASLSLAWDERSIFLTFFSSLSLANCLLLIWFINFAGVVIELVIVQCCCISLSTSAVQCLFSSHPFFCIPSFHLFRPSLGQAVAFFGRFFFHINQHQTYLSAHTHTHTYTDQCQFISNLCKILQSHLENFPTRHSVGQFTGTDGLAALKIERGFNLPACSPPPLFIFILLIRLYSLAVFLKNGFIFFFFFFLLVAGCNENADFWAFSFHSHRSYLAMTIFSTSLVGPTGVLRTVTQERRRSRRRPNRRNWWGLLV